MDGSLKRTLGFGDAVVIGLGSMIGAGVFAAWSPAVRAAGSGGVLVGLAIAAVVACCNAWSSAELAALYPESGGTYVYGRRRLGDSWGHVAGWGFVVGKTASCAAMALTIGAYLWPDQARLVAVLAVAAVTAVNLGGLTRTVTVTKVLLTVSLAVLVAVVASAWSGSSVDLGDITMDGADPGGVLRAGGFLFFAFAGYARIATLGEEVRNPAVTIRRAIPVALLGVLAVYAVVALTSLATVGADALAATDAPLRVVADEGSLGWIGPIVRFGAAFASAGVLLNLVPGVSRTALAMARNGELPGWFGRIDTGRSLPVRGEVTIAAVVVIVVLLTNLRSAIAISGVAVLTYYAIANASALTLRDHERTVPRLVPVVGLLGCLILVAALPPPQIATGVAALGVGIAIRAISLWRRSPTAAP